MSGRRERWRRRRPPREPPLRSRRCWHRRRPGSRRGSPPLAGASAERPKSRLSTHARRARESRPTASYVGDPSLDVAVVDLTQDVRHVVADPPRRMVSLERVEVADPPAMIADPAFLSEAPVELASGDLLAQLDRLEH